MCMHKRKQAGKTESEWRKKREKGVWEGSLWTAKPMRHITWQLTCLKGTGRQAGQAYMSPLSRLRSLSLTPEGWRTQEESGHSEAEQAARRPGRSNNGELYNSGALSSLCLSIYLWWIVMTAHLQSTCLIWNGLRAGIILGVLRSARTPERMKLTAPPSALHNMCWPFSLSLPQS